MQKYFNKFVLGLKDKNTIITNYSQILDKIEMNIEMKQDFHTCPGCNETTSKVHDYRVRTFKHGKIHGYHLIIKYKRRRYVCKSCNKRFPEPNTIIERYAKISNLLNDLIIKDLKEKVTFKLVAKHNNISSSTVIRRHDKHFDINKLELPSVISIDEFKKSNNNSKNGKYALAIADPINKKLIDIIPNRQKHEFNEYLNTIDPKIKDSVNTVIIDMWEPYRALVKRHFTNANLVIDRFHYIRNVIWWFNDIRIKAMNSYTTNQKGYKILKKYNKLLIKNPNNISHLYEHDNYWKKSMSPASIINECLDVSEDLKKAYELYSFFQTNTFTPFDSKKESVEFIDEFVQKLFDSKLDNSIDLANMFINWKDEISNSLYLTFVRNEKKVRYSNGFIEGVNNYIKTFRRMCFNIRNFDRFTKRIITTFNDDFIIKT